jgi:anti-anti-sigma factor
MTDSAFPEQSPAEPLIELGELSLRSDRDGSVHTISLTGEMDLANAEQVEEEIVRVEATDAATIILDLTELAFIDSTGIRALIAAELRARADSNRLVFRRPPENVQRVLRIAGVEKSLRFED